MLMNRSSHLVGLPVVPSPRSTQAIPLPTPALAELVSTAFVKVPGWFSVSAALRVAELKGVSHLLVLDGNGVCGAVAVQELRTASPAAPLSRVARKTAAFLGPDDDVASAWLRMSEQDLPCLPVAKGAILLGIVTRDAVEGGRRVLPS
jgi:CBS domain-containing protein